MNSLSGGGSFGHEVLFRQPEMEVMTLKWSVSGSGTTSEARKSKARKRAIRVPSGWPPASPPPALASLPASRAARETSTLVHLGIWWVGVPHAVGGLEECLDI